MHEMYQLLDGTPQKSDIFYNEAKLLLLERTFQKKCADAKTKHERSIVTSFSSKPKTLFRHLSD